MALRLDADSPRRCYGSPVAGADLIRRRAFGGDTTSPRVVTRSDASRESGGTITRFRLITEGSRRRSQTPCLGVPGGVSRVVQVRWTPAHCARIGNPWRLRDPS